MTLFSTSFERILLEVHALASFYTRNESCGYARSFYWYYFRLLLSVSRLKYMPWQTSIHEMKAVVMLVLSIGITSGLQ